MNLSSYFRSLLRKSDLYSTIHFSSHLTFLILAVDHGSKVWSISEFDDVTIEVIELHDDNLIGA